MLRRFQLMTTPVAIAVGLACLAPVLHAQWPTYPWKNMPRLATGKIDMAAAPRRMADGHVDLSGFWMPTDVVRHLINLASDMKPGEIPLTPWAEGVLKERIETN